MRQPYWEVTNEGPSEAGKLVMAAVKKDISDETVQIANQDTKQSQQKRENQTRTKLERSVHNIQRIRNKREMAGRFRSVESHD